MKVRVKIISYHKWEKRKKWWTKDIKLRDDGEYDLLVCSAMRVLPLKVRILKELYWFSNKKYGYLFDQELNSFIDFFDVFVKRPHEYKKNDIIEIDIDVKIIGKVNE